MRSAQRTEHVTFSTLHSDELLSTKANISDKTEKLGEICSLTA